MNIPQLIEHFFLLFSNRSQKVASFEKASALFIPEVIVTRLLSDSSPNEYETMNLESFLLPRLQMLQDGTLTKFEEWQTEFKTQEVAAVAQHFCHYEKSGTFNGEPYSGKGTKLFQLIKTNTGWKISAIVWSDFT